MSSKEEYASFRCPKLLKQAYVDIAKSLDRSLSWVFCTKLKEALPDEIKQAIDAEIESNDKEEATSKGGAK